ncbi:[Fe-Fe] hydrogenase large subunit C-terminal domain-containing protein [Mesoterricola silvestris]|uniref:4Fe-4S ferredoxin n=1 Tax=Mesoterricola silvestris TaxID=2927979 RepID=A0AA48GNY9_9BACT|nr:[Fe-Fe] hydrogenase large subunit C-terminal domain-containing protein [Mesoterricola silvestris]BDU71327.1 4Fe-4S ferredoxin [Mesoterricola silvestris]
MRPGPVYSEQAQCQDCYKCVRACPVKAIRVSSAHAVVMPERCLACGACVSACPSGAKRVRDDLPLVEALLRGDRPVVASLAPSYLSEFPGGPGRIIAALKRLGFAGVSETALGAQEVSARLAQDLDAHTGRIWISTACPVAVDYVRTYLPERIPDLTPLDSPLLAHVRLLRAELGEAPVVFIGPCIAKKLEVEEAPTLAAALTFEDLRRWLDREGIDPLDLEPEGDFLLGPAAEGSLYPIEGGMARATALNMATGDTRFVTLSGLGPIREALADLPAPRGNVFLELLACPGGCVNGPAARRSPVGARMAVLDGASEAPGAYPREPAVPLERGFTARVPPAAGIPEGRLEAALRRLGKTGPGDELNCGACGYDTCRDLAGAILGGRAETRMCVSNLRRLAEKKANALLRTLPFGVVIVDEELRIIESNDQFVRLLGEEAALVAETQPGLCGAHIEKLVDFGGRFREVLEGGDELIRQNLASAGGTLSATIFTVEPGHVVGALLLDVTETEARQKEMVGKAEEVIQNMLANAQEIAFSLGRNAARSEGILNSIIAEFRGPHGA